jgi:hypothetical protein
MMSRGRNLYFTCRRGAPSGWFPELFACGPRINRLPRGRGANFIFCYLKGEDESEGGIFQVEGAL